ncbi:MAG: ArsR/SmtB family transcription factor [Clostridium neonatale]
MDKVKIFKALGNETRLNILLWLKEPQKNFEPQIHLSIMDDFQEGVCVGTIRKKAGLSQSTISGFLSITRRGRACRIKKYWAIYLF